MLVLAASLWAVSAPLLQDTETYRFKNVSARYVVVELLGGDAASRIIPESVTYKLQRETNSVLLRGLKTQIEPVLQAFAHFDVKSVRVEVEVEGVVAPIGHAFSNRITVLNNGTWTLSEPQLDFALAIRPRMNDDGSCTLFAKQAALGIATEATMRIKVGEKVRLVDGRMSESGSQDAANRIELSIRVVRVITATEAAKKS